MDELLIGRDKDKESFADQVLGDRLVILDGVSGVGKSSLVNVGLIPQLRTDGLVPLVCDDWTNTEDEGDPEQFIARKLRRELPPDIEPDGEGIDPLCVQLDLRYGERAVLVFDQFEEFIRYQPRMFQPMIDYLVRINREHETHVVLSLRSEYLHTLRELEQSVRPFSMSTYTLRPLDRSEHVLEVIKSANATRPGAIDSKAPTMLLGLWESASSTGRTQVTNAGLHVGLLQLQAALYTLHHRAAGGTVTREHIRKMNGDALGAKLSLFDLAMREAVGLKLERCQLACTHETLLTPIDSVLTLGTAGMVQRIASQLSSGGYKLVREEWDLAQSTLGQDLERLGGGADDSLALYRRLSASARIPSTGDGHDLLTVPRSSIQTPPTATEQKDDSGLTQLGLYPPPWTVDPLDLTSGPMFGMPPGSILVEELRRFVFALVWLHKASLVRSTSPANGQSMISLIHDGFGPALTDWASSREIGPGQALNRLTAANGERFTWQVDRSHEPAYKEFDGGDGHLTIANVRWRNSLVSASFRNLVFVNCDFRGTRFEQCGFRGVVFINCLLDGATFGECTIFGEVDAIENERQSVLPAFRVRVSPEIVGILIRYRGWANPDPELGQSSDELLSLTSGLPAVPWRDTLDPVSGEKEPVSTVPWKPHAGGLTMYGGRLSALMIRNCKFQERGTLAFRHIAGSSLDLVEQTGGHFEVYDSAIRGLTVTRSVEDADSDSDRPVEQRVEHADPGTDLKLGQSVEDGDPDADVLEGDDSFLLRFRSSLLANTWFGYRLSGRARFNDCRVWQLLNLSDRDSFEVVIEDCGHHGLVNVNMPDRDSGPIVEMTSEEIVDPDHFIARASLRMDYRSVPARLEFE